MVISSRRAIANCQNFSQLFTQKYSNLFYILSLLHFVSRNGSFSLFVLAALLIAIRTPLTLSQVETESYKTTQVSIQAQVNSPTNSITTPEIPKQKPNSQNGEQNFPVVLDGETLFYFSSIIEGKLKRI